METDTIKEGPVFYLGGPVEIAGTVDHETGSASYTIAFVPDESAAVEDNDSRKKILAKHLHKSKKSRTFAPSLTS